MYLQGVMPNDTAKELLLGIEVALNALSFFKQTIVILKVYKRNSNTQVATIKCCISHRWDFLVGCME